MSNANLQDKFTNPEMNNTCLQHIIAQNAEILKVLLQLVQTLASNQLNSCCCGRAQSEAPLKSASLEPPSVNYNIANPQRPDQRPIPQQKFVRPLNGEWPSTRSWFNSNKFHNQGFQHKFCGYCKRVGHTMGQCRYRPFCQYCGKRGHTFEECYEAKNQCLYCQQQGHVVQNCPVKNNLKVGCPFCDEQHLGKDCQTKTRMEPACSVVEDCISKPESLPINETSERTQGVEEPLEKHLDQPSVNLMKRLPHSQELAENESKLIIQDTKNLNRADLLDGKAITNRRPELIELHPQPPLNAMIVPITVKEDLRVANLTAYVDIATIESFLTVSKYYQLNHQQIPLEQTNNLRAVRVRRGRTTIPILGEVILSIQLSSKHSLRPHKFLVIPEGVSDHDLVLGYSLLEKNGLFPNSSGELWVTLTGGAKKMVAKAEQGCCIEEKNFTYPDISSQQFKSTAPPV